MIQNPKSTTQKKMQPTQECRDYELGTNSTGTQQTYRNENRDPLNKKN